MVKRLLTIAVLIMMPTGAWADEVAPTADAPSPTPVTQSASNGLQSSNGGVGGSNADSSALQPAGGAGLGASNSAAAGLTAPTGSNLQGTTNANDQLKTLLNDEADGAPQEPAAASTDDFWLAGLLISLIALGGVAGWYVRRRQLVRAHARFAVPEVGDER